MSWEELGDELARGGRFVSFPYCISILIVTFRRSSDVCFVRKGESTLGLAVPYLAISLVCGWWGLPWGPIWTIGSLLTILTGGKDHTEEMLSAMPLARAYRDGRGGEDNDTAYLDDHELEEAANRVALLLSEVNHIREAAGRYYQSLSPGDLDDVIAAIEDSTEWAESEQHPRGARHVVQIFTQTLNLMLVGLEATAERDRYATQRALAQAREGLELLEATYERFQAVLRSRRERARRRGLFQTGAANRAARSSPWWVHAGAGIGIVFLLLSCYWGPMLYRDRTKPSGERRTAEVEGVSSPAPVPIAASATPQLLSPSPTRVSTWTPTPVTPEGICHESIGGCIEAPRAWSCAPDEGSLLCDVVGKGFVALSLEEGMSPATPEELKRWYADWDNDEAEWQWLGEPSAQTRSIGKAQCTSVTADARWGDTTQRATVTYYECLVTSRDTLTLMAYRPRATRHPSQEDVEHLIGSYAAGSPAPASDSQQVSR